MDSKRRRLVQLAATGRQTWKKRLRGFTLVFVVALLSGSIVYVFLRPPGKVPLSSNKPTTPQGPNSGSLTKGNPEYDTLTPDAEPIDKLGGWTKISPPSSAPVYAYADSIGKITITVSQQPLPKQLKEETMSKIEDLARSYNATRYINAQDTRVYIGTSRKGPQSLLFAKRDLLILIKSAAPINDSKWIAYVNSLR